MSGEKVILLLGRRDEPTDGVADYCEKLKEAGGQQGLAFEIAQVPWAERGWSRALAELRETAASWRGRWVLLQYTTLAWSRRGFPLRAPHILEIIRQSGARPGVVFHDFMPLPGSGVVGRTREYFHLRVLRKLYSRTELGIFTVPLNKISWLSSDRGNAVFIPVGANYAQSAHAMHAADSLINKVAVYSITGGDRTSIEVADIAAAVKQAAKAAGPIQLILFGRGSREAEPALRSALNGVDVKIESLGLLSPAEVSQALARASVLLFVRGQVSSRRGSAIAGIACGLPIVCYSGSETAWPITEAGILPSPMGDREGIAAALENVLTDSTLRETLAERSRAAHEKYFSWKAITAQFAAALQADSNARGVESHTTPPHSVRVA